MSQEGLIEVIGRDGWRKEFALRKAIAFIGSDPNADIPLEGSFGAGIAGRHLQLIAVPEAGYRLVNLGESEVFLGAAADRAVAPRFSAELSDGEQIKVGDFTLVFHSETASAGVVTGAGGMYRQSQHIGLRVTLPQKQIAPHRTLEGIVTVSNLGDHPGAQFELGLDGLDRAYFEMEPGPLLSSGAEKEVLFRLYHRGSKPLAGDYRLTIYAMAPRAYSAEQVSLSQTVKFLPLYEHKLTLTPAGVKPAPPPALEEPKPEARPQPAPPAPVEAVSSPPAQPEVITVEATPVTTPPPVSPSWWSRVRQRFFPARSEKMIEKLPGPEIVISETAPPQTVESVPEPPQSPADWWGDQAAPVVEAEQPAVEVTAEPEAPPPPPETLPAPPPVQPPAEAAPAEPATPELPPPAVKVQPVTPAMPAATEDWWQAAPPASATSPVTASSPEAADWWTTPPAQPPVRPESRPVLKIKATPELSPEESSQSNPTAAGQDWWSSSAEADSSQKKKSKGEAED